MALDVLSTALTGTLPNPTKIGSSGAGSAGATGAAPTSFSDALQGLVKAVDGSEATANTAIGKMIDGSGDVHEAMIALQRADMMLQLTVQVRNKLVQAYQDVMRMPV
jgi:flagellar hook-basal body complex protein FliE